MKRYTDTKSSARAQDFQSGDFVKARLPGHRRKGVLRYSELRQIISQRGAGTFLLDDRKVWNSSKISRVHFERINSWRDRTVNVSPLPAAFSWYPEASNDCSGTPTLPDSVQLYPDRTTDDVQPVSPVHGSTQILPLPRSVRPGTVPTRYKDCLYLV